MAIVVQVALGAKTFRWETGADLGPLVLGLGLDPVVVGHKVIDGTLALAVGDPLSGGQLGDAGHEPFNLVHRHHHDHVLGLPR